MWTRSEPPLLLEPCTSPRLAALLLTGCGGAVLLPWLSAMPRPLALALSLLALVGGARGLRAGLWRQGARGVRALRRGAAGEWRLTTGDGRELPAQLEAERFVTPWLVVLRLRALAGGRPYPVVLAADAVPAEAFRRLRATLRAER